MASDPRLRLSQRPAMAERFAVSAIGRATLVLATALVALGAVALIDPGPGRREPGSSSPVPRFLAEALGAPQAPAPSARKRRTGPLARRSIDGARLEITNGGFGASRRGAQVRLSAQTPGAGSWQPRENGAVRPAPFGVETVVVGPRSIEQHSIVTRRQGLRVWRWRIDGNLNPRLRLDGSVALSRRGVTSALEIVPVAILDHRGRDVTPAGSRWSLARRGGHAFLTLRLDDSQLPLPYVIDPGITTRGTVTTATAASSSATSLTINVPTGVVNGDLLVLQLSVRSAASQTVTSGLTGWTAIPAASTGVQSGATSSDVKQFLFWKRASSEPASYTPVWSTGSDAAAVMVAYTNVSGDTPPYDTAGSPAGPTQVTAASGNPTIPTFNTSVGNTLLVAAVSMARGTSWTPANGGTPNLTFTERADLATTSAAKVTAEIADAPVSSAGTTGSRTPTAAQTNAPSVGQMFALKQVAADGSGTMSVSPSSVNAGSTGNRFTFTYTAAAGGMANGVIQLTVPSGWTAPSTSSSNAGYTTAGTGTVSLSGQVVTVTGVTLAGSATMTITYGASPGPGVTAPTSVGSSAFAAAQASVATGDGGVVTSLASSPGVTVAPAAATKLVITSSTANLSSGATRTLTAEVRDAYDNVRTSDNSTSVTFAKTAGAGTVTGTGSATASSGIASKTVTAVTAGSITITASASGLTSASTTFTVDPGSATHLVVTSSTANLASGFTRAITAEARDANDNVVTSDNSTSVTFAKTAGTGTVTGLGSATASSGVASDTVTALTAGSITITASAAGLTSGTTTFTIVVGAADHLTITSSTANLTSGSSRALTAEVRDANDNVLSSDSSTSVTFAKTAGAGTVTGTGAATASSGIASKTVTAVGAGSITVTASASGLTSAATTFALVAGSATKLVVTSSTADLASGSSRTLTAEVRDANDNVVTGDNSTSVTFAKTAGTGTVTGLGSATASSGVASETVTAATAGSITITASAAGLTSGTSVFDVVAGAADHLTITSSTANLASGSSRSVTAEVRDANGNVVTADNSTSVTFAKTAGTGTVTGTGSATASSGIASKTVTAVTAGSVTITVSASGLTSGTTSFTLVPGAADHLTVTSSTANLISGASRTLTAEVRDANENLLTGDSSTSVTFAKTAGTGTATGLGGATASAGIASKAVTASASGSITITASAGGVTSGTTTFTVVDAGPDHLTVTSSAGDLASGGARTLTVEVRDAVDNIVTGDNSTSVTFAKTAGAGTVTGLASATAAGGVASLSISGQSAGSITITASASGLTSAGTTFTIVPGAADHLAVTSSTADLASGAGRTLTVEVRDAAGNLVTGDSSTPVSFAKTAGAGTATGLGSATAASGIASKTVTAALAGSITITASATGLTPDTTTFTVVPGAAGHLTVTSSTADLTSGAGRTLTADVRDAAGNLVSGDSSTSVTFAKTGGAGTVNGLGSATASAGVASRSVTGDLAGAITITASATGLTPDTTTFTVVPGAADHLAFTSSTSDLASGSARALTAEVRDAAGNLITGDSSTSVTFAKTGGAGTVTGLGAATASAGIASRTVTGVTAGSITLTAGAAGLTGASATFAVVAGPADHLVITGSTADLASGASRSVTAEIRDAADNLVDGDSSTSVLVSQTGGTGSVTGAGSSTAAAGVASKSVTGAVAGTVTLTASATGLISATTSFSVLPGAADHLTVTSSAADLGSGSTRSLTAEIRDAAGNLVAADSSTSVTFAKTGGAGTVTGLGSATAAGGVASRTATGATAGSITITASATGLTSGTTTFAVVAGPADHLAIVSSSSDLASGASRAITAEVRDASDNLVGSDSTTSVTVAQTGGTGTVSGTGSSTASGGSAATTVTGAAAGSVTLTASATGLTSATTTFTVVPGALDHLTITSSTADLASGSARSLTAELRDAAGNLVSGDSSTSVTFAKTGGAGTLSGLGAATAAAGTASRAVTGDLAGSITVTASAAGLSSDTTTFAVVPGSPAALVLGGGTSNLASGSGRTLTATVKDGAGNTVTSDSTTTVTFAQSGGAGSVTGLGAASASNGIASIAVTGANAGAVTVSVSAPLLAGDTLGFTVVPGPASAVVVTSSTGNLTAGASRSLTAEIRDAVGNLVSGDNSTSVTFARTGGTGTLTGLGAATATGGTASLTVTAHDAGSITVGATATGLTAGSSSFAIVAAAADHLTVTSSTANLASSSTRTLTAEVRDAFENLVATDNSTSVTFAKTSGSGTVSGLGSATASAGIAALDVTGQTAGTVTIGATATGLGGDSTAFTVVAAGTPTQVVVTSSTSDLASGGTRVLTAEVRDGADNLVGSDNSTVVTFAKTAGAGTVTGLASATAAGGVASITVTGELAGSITLGATASGLAAGSTTFDVVAGAPDRLIVTSGTGDLASGTVRTLSVVVRDAAGNLVTTDNSTSVTFSKTAGTGTVTGLGSATASNGVASLDATGDAAGPITIAASAAGLTGDSTTFSVVAGAADHLVFTSSTADLVSGSSRTLAVEVRDAAGNLRTADNATSVTFAKSAGGGSVTGLGTATASGGIASLDATGDTAASITIAATSSGLSSASTTFAIIPGAAHHLTITTAAAPLASGGSRALTAEVRDAANNLVASDSSTSITFAKTAGAGSLSGLGSATASAGSASVTLTGVVAGSVTVTASATGLASDATTFSVTPGTPAAIALTGATADLASGATRVLSATVRDAAGNAVTTDSTTTVDFAQTLGPGSLAGLGTATASAGVATKTVTGDLAGSVTVTASAPLLSADTLGFGIVAGPLDHLSVTSSAADLRVTAQRTLTAALRDAAGNRVLSDSSTVVAFGQTGGAGAVSGLGTSTASAGVAALAVTGQTAGAITIGASTAGAASGSTSFTVVERAVATIDSIDVPAVTSSTGATVTFSASEPSTFECSLDGAAFTPCTSPTTASGLADGPHTFDVHAVAGGVAGPDASTSWVVDTGAPTTTIDSGPSGTTAVDAASFTFSASESGTVFECSLDGAAFAGCSSPVTLSTLANGSHTFQARATDAAGNLGAAASRTWTVAAPPPSVAITAPLAYVVTTTATIAADATDTGTGLASVTFSECSNTSSGCASGTWSTLDVDTTSPYSASWNPVPGDGPRAIRAVADDGHGRSSASVVTVTVDRTAPAGSLTSPGANVHGAVALSATAGDATSGVNTVDFQHSPAGADTWTSVGSDSSAPYAATWSTSAADDGVYDLRIFVTDRAGNTATSVVTNVRVDDTPPTASLDDPGAYRHGTIALSATASDTGSGIDTGATRFEARVGSGAWATVPATWTPADATWDVRAVVADNAGNETTTSARTVVVDNTAPATNDDAPAAWRNTPVTVTLSAADPESGVASTEYRIDGGSWTAGSSVAIPAPAATEHVYSIDYRSTNRAGVVESTRTTSVRIDTKAPDATMSPLPANVRGTVSLSSTVSDAGSDVNSVSYQSIPGTADASVPANWSATGASWDTSGLADGNYKVRVVAIDNAGNGVLSPHVTTCVDNHAPTTSDDAPGGARASDVTVTLSPADGTGCGPLTTEYRIDGGSFLAGTSLLVPAPGDHSNDGDHTIEYRSTDGAVNVEALQTAHVLIDTTAPGDPGAGDPGSYLRGIVTLNASPPDPDVASVEWRLRAAGSSGSWASLGSDTAVPYALDWNTASVGDGSYDLQIVVTDAAGNSSTTALSSKTVDNTAPSGSLTGPADGAVVGGTVAVSAGASDATAGVASVAFQVKGSGAGSFATIATDTTAPFAASWSSTAVADGPADLRAVVTDLAGNTFVAPIRTVTVDNDVPVVTLADPGANVRGTIALGASSSADTAQVEFQRQTSGGAWSTFATDTAAPFTASFDTTAVADGDLVLRAEATDVGGNLGASAARTTRVDNTGPTGAVTSPSAGATIGGTAVSLAATATDAGAGVTSVTFQIRAASSAGPWTDVSTDTAAPYTATLDASTLASGGYDLRVVATDGAGNQAASAAVGVTVDSTAPGVTFNGLDPVISGSYTLRATVSGSGAVHVRFEERPSGGSWSEIATDTTAPYTAAWDTTTLADGLYDLRITVADGFGNASSDLAQDIRLDNTAPRLVSSSPADGSTLTSAASIDITASEPLAAVTGLTLDDGAAPAPAVSGASASFGTGALPGGPHTLAGRLVDAAGQSRLFRVDFTIYVPASASADAPPVSKNIDAGTTGVLTATDASATVTAPVGSYAAPASNPGDWLVLTVDPTPPTSLPTDGLAAGAAILDVTARWAIGGSLQHDFLAPLDLTLANTSGQQVLPATFEGGRWRPIAPMPSAGSLPTGWADGFYSAADGIHILTRHLSLFTLLRDLAPPSPVHSVVAVVADDGLTLRWIPGADNSGVWGRVLLLVNGLTFQVFDPTQFEVKLGPIDANDTREFSFVQLDAAGNRSVPTTALLTVPPLAGLTLDQARAALAARGFTVGSVTQRIASAPAGTVLQPSGVELRFKGSSVDLVLASGAPQTKLVLEVTGTKRVGVAPRTVAARIKLTKAARVTASLHGPEKLRHYTWTRQLKAGKSIVRLRIPSQIARKPGLYSIVWIARSGNELVRRVQQVRIGGAPRAGARPDVVLTPPAAMQARIARSLAGGVTRPIEAEGDTAFRVASSQQTNVQVVVVDVDVSGLELVRDLRTLFPDVRIVALGARARVLTDAVRAGATIALPSSTPAARIAAVVERLARG